MDKSSPPPKKTYLKPKITRVKLAPSEAVLGSCKTSSSAGPAQGECDLPGSCYGTGS